MKNGSARILKQAAATEDFPRHSEAGLITLNDGRLLLAWTKKIGGDDFAKGEIIGMYSADGGMTWDDEPHVIQRIWPGIFDIMCPALIRTSRGIHHFFAGRRAVEEGANVYHAKLDIFQTLSTDEGKSWSAPEKINLREGYNVIVNARTVVLESGRILIPVAFVAGAIFEEYNRMRVFCYYSDDLGRTWNVSEEIGLPDAPIMEPSVVQCQDGSLYMSLRTKLGYLYESRSHDDGTSWSAPSQSPLPSAEAPSTLFRPPSEKTLWIFWCNTPYEPGKGKWFERHDIAWAFSEDDGKTWSAPETIEQDPEKSFGYITANPAGTNLLLTYYEWPLAPFLNKSKPHFWGTSLKQKIIPLEWFRERKSTTNH